MVPDYEDGCRSIILVTYLVYQDHVEVSQSAVGYLHGDRFEYHIHSRLILAMVILAI